MKAYNENVFMTRRYPELREKQRRRDSKIAKRMIMAHDQNNDPQKVFDVFKKEHKQLSHPRFWELLRSVWVATGSQAKLDDFLQWFNSSRPYRWYFSTPQEAERLRALDDPLTVYRAISGPEDKGISWTLSRRFAEQYAKDFKREIITQQVRKADVFALVERRGEEEIIILNK